MLSVGNENYKMVYTIDREGIKHFSILPISTISLDFP